MGQSVKWRYVVLCGQMGQGVKWRYVVLCGKMGQGVKLSGLRLERNPDYTKEYIYN
jgi:hypothetical protein